MVNPIPLLNLKTLEFQIADLSMMELRIKSKMEWIHKKNRWGKNIKQELHFSPEVRFNLRSVDNEKISVEEAKMEYGEMRFLFGLKAIIVNQSNEKMELPRRDEFPAEIEYPNDDVIPPKFLEYNLLLYTYSSLSEVNRNWETFIARLNKKESEHVSELGNVRASYDKRIFILRGRIDEIQEKHSKDLDKLWIKVFDTKKIANERAEDMIDKALM